MTNYLMTTSKSAFNKDSRSKTVLSKSGLILANLFKLHSFLRLQNLLKLLDLLKLPKMVYIPNLLEVVGRIAELAEC